MDKSQNFVPVCNRRNDLLNILALKKNCVLLPFMVNFHFNARLNSNSLTFGNFQPNSKFGQIHCMTFSKSMRRQILAKQIGSSACFQTLSRGSAPIGTCHLHTNYRSDAKLLLLSLSKGNILNLQLGTFSNLCSLLTSYFLSRVIVKYERVKNWEEIFGRYLILCLTKILLIFVLRIVRRLKNRSKL